MRLGVTLAILFSVTTGLTFADPPASRPTTAPALPFVIRIGQIDHPAITESSGVVASRSYSGVFWTHNDSGNAATLFAITREGKLISEFPVGAVNNDWEDIAIDQSGKLYIADIGNNGGRRRQVSVHRLSEPNPRAKTIPGFRPVPLKVTATWQLRYPAESFDAESLFVFEGYGYVISKLFTGGQAALYRFPLTTPADAQPSVLEHVAIVPIRSPVTAADISADGRVLAVLSVTGLTLFEINGAPAAIEHARSVFISHLHVGQEACCFCDDGILVTTEARDVFLFRAHLPEVRPTSQPASRPAAAAVSTGSVGIFRE